MKYILGYLFAFVGLGLIPTPSSCAQQETNNVKIIAFKVLDSPLVIKSDAPMSIDDPRVSLPFVSLEFAFWKCTNWEQVLAIHTSDSKEVMEKLQMREHFEEARMRAGGTNVYEQTFTVYVHFEEGGQEKMLAQCVPFAAKPEELMKIVAFRVQGYTKVVNDWKIDKTLQTSDLAAILVNSTPSELKKIEEWVKATGQSKEQK